MKTATPKVEIKQLAKVYPNGDGVRDINLDIREGEIITLLGPSGCGKTTILRALGGFIDVTRGSISINGEEVTHLPPEQRPTGMVFQSYNLWPHMTVEENLAFGLKLRKTPKKDIKRRIEEMLEIMRLPGTEKKYPNQLSGGQQQRIAIARSLLLEPAVLLMDEPFSALDAKIRMQMREELKRIQAELNITVVFVTHDQEEAMSLSHRIVVMDKGKMAQVGTPAEIYDKPASTYVASFIGEMNFLERGGEQLAFRPEDVSIHTDGNGMRSGVIRSIMLLGHYASVTIQTENTTIKAFVPRHETVELEEGQTISFDLNKLLTYKKGA
ncbi:ABC transporter ATP-binding protein [Atopococcus tabaci]|uniref:ABC transporter ATP-binding protein n=1 Tax=Atopococcus tabaci TaxID=269774 RepID=UPI000425BE52|nr:ABC transporter ATP-binding protein [Atopococcus tabaci]